MRLTLLHKQKIKVNKAQKVTKKSGNVQAWKNYLSRRCPFRLSADKPHHCPLVLNFFVLSTDSSIKPVELQYLPPLTLCFTYPNDYPSNNPPFYTLSSNWLNTPRVSKYAVCLFIQFVKENIEWLGFKLHDGRLKYMCLNFILWWQYHEYLLTLWKQKFKQIYFNLLLLY